MSESLVEETVSEYRALVRRLRQAVASWPAREAADAITRLADRVEELEHENRELWDRARDEKDRVWAMYEAQKARVGELERWSSDAALALEAASVIGEREGCHLNYSNHDRLLAERQALSPPMDAEST